MDSPSCKPLISSFGCLRLPAISSVDERRKNLNPPSLCTRGREGGREGGREREAGADFNRLVCACGMWMTSCLCMCMTPCVFMLDASDTRDGGMAHLFNPVDVLAAITSVSRSRARARSLSLCLCIHLVMSFCQTSWLPSQCAPALVCVCFVGVYMYLHTQLLYNVCV